MVQPQTKNGDPTNFSRTFNYLTVTQVLQGAYLSSSILGSFVILLHPIMLDDSSTGEHAAKILKVAWLSLPLGVIFTAIACVAVFRWQNLSYSSPNGQAILLNGFACLLGLLAEPLIFLLSICFVSNCG